MLDRIQKIMKTSLAEKYLQMLVTFSDSQLLMLALIGSDNVKITNFTIANCHDTDIQRTMELLLILRDGLVEKNKSVCKT